MGLEQQEDSIIALTSPSPRSAVPIYRTLSRVVADAYACPMSLISVTLLMHGGPATIHCPGAHRSSREFAPATIQHPEHTGASHCADDEIERPHTSCTAGPVIRPHVCPMGLTSLRLYLHGCSAAARRSSRRTTLPALRQGLDAEPDGTSPQVVLTIVPARGIRGTQSRRQRRHWDSSSRGRHPRRAQPRRMRHASPRLPRRVSPRPSRAARGRRLTRSTAKRAGTPFAHRFCT